MSIVLQNKSKSRLAVDINSSAMSLTVDSGTGDNFATCDSESHMWITIIDQTTYGGESEILEIVKVSPRSGDTFTIVERGAEGTTARAFVIGDIVEQRITAQTLFDLGVSTNKNRKYVDEIYITLKRHEEFSNSFEMERFNDKYAPQLISNWDSYWGSRLKVQVEDITTHVIYDNLSFDTTDDMYNWGSAHCTLDALSTYNETLIARPYEVIDSSIPTPSKIYGLNRFYSSIKGRKNYNNNLICTANNSNLLSACTTIFNSVWGTSLTDMDMDIHSIWLGRPKKNKYSNPPFLKDGQYVVNFDTANAPTRREYNINDGVFYDNSFDQYSNVSSTVRYAFIETGNYNVNITGVDEWTSINSSIKDSGSSYIIACGVQNNNANERKAVVIKPLGIDQVVMMMPDFEIYDFEIVFYNNDMQNHIYVKSFTDDTDFIDTFIDIDGGKMLMNSSEWLSVDINSQTYVSHNSTGYNDLPWSTVRFRLRNKITKEISELSESGIVTEKKHNLKQLQMKIKSFNS